MMPTNDPADREYVIKLLKADLKRPLWSEWLEPAVHLYAREDWDNARRSLLETIDQAEELALTLPEVGYRIRATALV